MRRLFLAMFLLAGVAPAAHAQDDPSFNLVNRSGRTINEIYASPVTQQQWGRDQLGTGVLPAGRSFAVRLDPRGGCRTDIMVVYAGGEREERRDVDTCRTTDVVFPATAAQAPPTGGKQGTERSAAATGNPSFNLINRGTRTIQEFYASPASQSTWGPDRLGAGVLPAGDTFPVRLPVGECAYDLRVVWADGESEERRNVNTCDVADVSFP
jgi:hypothetical protein